MYTRNMNNAPIIKSTFNTREDAQEFANLRSMIDGCAVKGPYQDGTQWVVYSQEK